MSATPYGLRSREWHRVLAFADAVRSPKQARGTTLRFDEDGIAHLRGEYACAQRASFGFTAREAAALRAQLAGCGTRLSPDEAEGALAAAIAALDSGATYDERLANRRPRETKSADDIRARRTANKRAQRARWIAARLCPTCGSEPAPCHTSCGRCLDAALARKAARKSAARFSADDNLCSPY